MATQQATVIVEPVTGEQPPVRKRYARIAPLYKAMIWTSFALNLMLFIVVGVLLGIVLLERRQMADLLQNTRSFAGANIAELQDVVTKLEGATIRYNLPLDQQLNLEGKGVVVPVDQETEVVLTQPVPLSLAGADIDLGAGNRLRASNINLTLPEGTPLRIRLNMAIPLDQVKIPVQINVPVEIPLAQTELGPQFQRLGAIVERLVTPAEPLLIRPSVVPYSVRPASVPAAAPGAPGNAVEQAAPAQVGPPPAPAEATVTP